MIIDLHRRNHPGVFEVAFCVVRRDFAYIRLVWFEIGVYTDDTWDEFNRDYSCAGDEL